MYSVEWDITGGYGAEKRISAEIASMLRDSVSFADRLEDILTAVSEACLNAMEHGNRLNHFSRVRVRMSAFRAKLVFRIADEGNGFDYKSWTKLKYEPAYFANKLEEDVPRGWGLYLISSLADNVRFGREGGVFYTEIEFAHKQNGGVHPEWTTSLK